MEFDGLALRMVALEKRGPLLRVVRCGKIKAEIATLDNGIIAEAESLAQEIKTLWASWRIRDNEVVASLPGQQVLVRTLKMPVMKKRELRAAARYQAITVLPIPFDDAVVDAMGYTVEPDGQAEVSIAACRRSYAEQVVQILLEAGLRPRALEIAPPAMLRIVRVRENVQALLNPGEVISTFSVFALGCLKFMRVFPVHDFHQLSEEINRCLEYLDSQSAMACERMAVIGGGPQREETVDFLSARLPLEVNLELPLMPIKYDLDLADVGGFSPEYYAAAIGLAARRRPWL
jgi:hypothetical protein